MSDTQTITTTGRRKTAIARVWLVTTGDGKFVINNLPVDKFFRGNTRQVDKVYEPLKVVNTLNAMDVKATVLGGGINGQSEAIRHGLSRALAKISDEYKKLLKQHGFLTRDPRMVERKKSGQPKARKKFQWTKR
ncbi:MAG: 30S ribosomal protein S9 [Elusimicrobiota bacterium]